MAYIEFENVDAVEKRIVAIEKEHNIAHFNWKKIRHKITAHLVGGQVDE